MDVDKIKKALEIIWGKQYHIEIYEDNIFIHHKIMKYTVALTKGETPYKIPTYRLGMDSTKYKVRLTTLDLKNIKATLYALGWITDEQAEQELKDVYENI